MFLRFVAVVAALAALPAAAQAATIDFTEAAPGFQGTTTLSLTNVDILASGDDIFIVPPGFSGAGTLGGFCAIVGQVCTGSAAIGFAVGPVSDLMFEVAGFNDGDTAVASVFADPAGPALASRTIAADGVVDFSGIAGITALILLDLGSTGFGVQYTNFSFTQGIDTPVVPLPAALPIMLTALASFGLVRHRRA